MIELVPATVLACWRDFQRARIEPVADGLINDTFLVELPDGVEAILQRLHPVFPPQVNSDIAHVTARLKERDVHTPELIPTRSGELWVVDDGRTWRALTCIAGRTLHRLDSETQAWSAGALTGRFHAALLRFDYAYQAQRPEPHVTAGHLAWLRRALESQADHPLYTDVFTQAQSLLQAPLPVDVPSLPLRHAHGDLKISNLLFDDDHAVALIDLDTLGRMPWPFEMGDALRSWCNPREEDAVGASLDLRLLDAALQGYASAGVALQAVERESLIAGVAQIALELAVRFLSDALEERYFGWDAARYPSRGAHNLARGRAMAELYHNVMEQRVEAEGIVRRRLG